MLTYLLQLDRLELNTSFELQNLTDAQVFDEFGVQKPGRAYYVKVRGRR